MTIYKPLSNLLFFALLFFSSLTSAQPVNRDILSSGLGNKDLSKLLMSGSSWREAQKAEWLAGIRSLSPEDKQMLIASADQALTYDWPVFRASRYLEFRDKGDRVGFESVYFQRRHMLSQLIAGELVTNSGKYLPQICDGLWMIMEESTWAIPAHMNLQKAGANLPDPDEKVIDLFAGSTSAMLATAALLLDRQLDGVSPFIRKRISKELKERILEPYLQRDDFWWMGFTGKMVNNWNIWINTNILKTALLAAEDSISRNAVILKTIKSADHFLNYYPEDGGCDEGPSYWTYAGGELVVYMNLLEKATGGALNWNDETLIHNIGKYIYKVHIADNFFVNFADATPRTTPDPVRVFKFGQVYNDDDLKSFASYFRKLNPALPSTDILKLTELLEVYPVLDATPAKAPLKTENWLPNSEVLALRSSNGQKGLFFAAQGGHNAESHNHNDVGNFILYVDSVPAIIDLGAGTYTKKTFGKDRYSIWNMQSQWHNCPQINGQMQRHGKEYEATEVSFVPGKSVKTYSLNLAKAYPAEAEVISWKRQFHFYPSRQKLVLEENYLLKDYKEPSVLHFLTGLTIEHPKAGEVILRHPQTEKGILKIQYDPGLFSFRQEKKKCDDARLESQWGPEVSRISLTSLNKELQGAHKLQFTKL